MTPTPKTQHPSVELLRSLYRDFPGHTIELRAIDNDKTRRSPPVRTWVKTPTQIAEFCEQFEDKTKNVSVYFGVCKRREGGGKKDDVMGVTALWVDIDTVNLGWDTDKCAAAIFNLPPEIRPSACVHSGGGLHLYWYLDDPQIEEDYSEVEYANEQLAAIFYGDHVHNVDRILRLPGTWNTKRGVSKAKRAEILWNHDFHRLRFDALMNSAEWFEGVLYNGEFIHKDNVPKETPPTNDTIIRNVLGRNTKKAAEKNVQAIWDRARLHGGRGYYGLDEAITLTTARLVCLGEMSDEAIVTFTYNRLKEVHPEANEADERKKIADKLERWKPKWQAALKEEKIRKKAERAALKQKAKDDEARSD